MAFLTVLPVAAGAPVIDSLVAVPQTVVPGGSIELTLQAHDPDCAGTCTSGCGQYLLAGLTDWTATGGSFPAIDNGVSGSPYTATATWQAPDTEGIYTISVHVADSGTFLCGGRESATRPIDVLVAESVNEPPVVTSLVADPLQLLVGEASSLTCSGNDPEGSPLVYSWTSDSGLVTPGMAGSALFTSDDPAGATVTCRVTDPEGAFGEASILLTVAGALPEKMLTAGLVAPQRLSVDSRGSVYVVDPAGGGLSVLNLLSGRFVYRLSLDGATSVAVDWNDNLLVGGQAGAVVTDAHGNPVLALTSDEPLGEVVDVAVDSAGRRYGVLHRAAARVVVFDESGTKLGAFGSNGDGPDQLKSPHGLAVDAAGNWVVADSGHGQIKTFDPAGALLSAIGDLGGGNGEFVQLDDVAVDASGVVYATDSFQDRVVTFFPDGALREILGGYGTQTGQFKTATGIALAPAFDRVLVGSANSSSVQVFVTTGAPVEDGPRPLADVQPAAVPFGPQAVGTTSPSRSVTVNNVGDAPLGIRRARAGAEFTATHACSFVAPGAGCNIDVEFAPTTLGVVAGTLTIDTSAVGPPEEIALSGFGFLPASLTVTPSRLDFSDQEVGSVSEPESLTLLNGGTDPLTLFGISGSPEFIQSNDCGAALPGGTGCTIQVSFAPQSVADYINGTVTIGSDAANGPHSVELEGRGIPGAVSIAIANRTAPEGEGQLAFPVTLSNPGAETVSVSYTTAADGATEGTDYELASGTLSFDPGETSGTILVTVLDDALLEPLHESLFVLLSDPIGAELADAQAVGTIVDDEQCPGPELLTNPGAEETLGGPGIPGWTAAAGGDWQRGVAPPDPFEGEAYFFAGSSDTAELVQDVDLSAYAARIAAGDQRFVFGGRVRSRDEPLPDAARIVVEYRDTANTAVLDAFDSGELVSPLDWLAVADERVAPVGTGWIRLRLIATRNDGMLNDALFDDLSLHSLRAATIAPADAWRYEGHDAPAGEMLFPVTSSCPYYEPVTLGFVTMDGSALAGEDYLAAAGSVTLAEGQTELSIPVTVVGDRIVEDHETFELQLEFPNPTEAVLLDDVAVGRIVNDDSCRREASWWLENLDAWPIDRLTIGAEELDRQALIDLLDSRGADMATRLAKQLVAAKLNLVAGSDPAILPLVEAADELLVEFLPGSDPRRRDHSRFRYLLKPLTRYNGSSCEDLTNGGSSRPWKPTLR